MSKYTTELRWLMESGYPFGLDKYPIFDEAYRATLNQKILNHYKFREIGYETAGLFVDRLNERMNVIMPYYNQLYRSTLIEFNPLLTYKMTEQNDIKRTENVKAESTENNNETNTQDSTQDNTQVMTQNTDGTTDTTANKTDKIHDVTDGTKTNSETGDNTNHADDTKTRKDVASDTPQGLLSTTTIENETYATTAAIGNDTAIHNDTSNHTIRTDEATKGTYDRDTEGNETSHGTTKQSANTDTTAKQKANQTATTDSKLTANSASDTSGWQNILKVIEGYQGISGSELLQQFRATFINIDQQIIAELETLFMCIY